MMEIESSGLETVDRLQRDVIAPLKRRFVGRDEIVDLIALAVVSGEHLFLLGPPGTAKSALIRQFAESVNGRYFEYLLTRFSEPNELFGAIDLLKLREGTVATVTQGMLPEAEFVFLDELFNANSAILNNLLTVLNERVYRRGAELHRLPLLSLFSASNQLSEDESLQALFDRFLIRCHVDNLKREAMPQLLSAGWALERTDPAEAAVAAADLRALSRRVFDVDLSAVAERYADLVWKVRDLGIGLSDRRAVKILKLVAASALLCGRSRAIASDLWVLRYVWDRQEQVDPLSALVLGFLEQQTKDKNSSEAQHPRSILPERVDAEDLAREIDELTAELNLEGLGLVALARLRERVGNLSDRAAWVTDDNTRKHLLGRTAGLMERLK